MKEERIAQCNMPTEVYSRVVGYFRPVQSWNEGKKAEFKDRKSYIIPTFADIKPDAAVGADAGV